MTGRALTLTREVHAALVAARRVGAPLRHCAKAAGVPWRTLCDWLRKGRDGDARFAPLAADLDAADAAIEQVLRARALKGTEKDARLAFDMVRWRESQAERKAGLRLAQAKATVEERRASGDHVDRHEFSSLAAPADLQARLAAAARAAAASPADDAGGADSDADRDASGV